MDIIVKKIQTVVTNQFDDSSDDDNFQHDKRTAKEINHALQLEGFKVTEKGKFIFKRSVAFYCSTLLF